jgi:hypothetical protein
MPPRPDLESWPSDGSLPAHAQAYVEWYCTPEFARAELGLPVSEAEWCRVNNFDNSSPRKWRGKRNVKKAIERQFAESNVSPDRVQAVVEAMHKAATQGDTKAAALFLQYIDRLAPKRVVIEDRRIESLSDEEFQQEVEKVLAGA